jgi:hypothetical protein
MVGPMQRVQVGWVEIANVFFSGGYRKPLSTVLAGVQFLVIVDDFPGIGLTRGEIKGVRKTQDRSSSRIFEQ